MSPIKKENRHRYPTNWHAISHRIRFLRARGRCECEGECGREHTSFTRAENETIPGPPSRRCLARHGQPSPMTGSLVVLTVAHMNHRPEDCRDENMKAHCQRCHLAYDASLHQENAKATREKKQDVDESER